MKDPVCKSVQANLFQKIVLKTISKIRHAFTPFVAFCTQFEAVCRDQDLICSLLVPSRPLKVIFKEVTNSSVAVHWQQPTTPNGIIVGYRIYYMHDNFTDVQTVRHTEPNMFHVLRGLSKYLLMT